MMRRRARNMVYGSRGMGVCARPRELLLFLPGARWRMLRADGESTCFLLGFLVY